VQIKVFDILGREIITLVNEKLPPGTYEVEFDPRGLGAGSSELTSGVYFYKLIADLFSVSRKMVIIK